jgi:hypothetical protein
MVPYPYFYLIQRGVSYSPILNVFKHCLGDAALCGLASCQLQLLTVAKGRRDASQQVLGVYQYHGALNIRYKGTNLGMFWNS